MDNDGNTALHLAAENNHPAVIRLLLDAGADSSIRNVAGGAPIHVAVSDTTTDALLVSNIFVFLNYVFLF